MARKKNVLCKSWVGCMGLYYFNVYALTFMEINEAKKCSTCKGERGGHADYRNSDGNVERGTGDWEDCSDCEGTGIENNEDLITERIIENLNNEQEEILQAKFIEEREIGGIPITKDNYEDLYENWLMSRTLLDFEEILK